MADIDASYTDAIRSMFQLIAKTVQKHSWLIILSWVVFAVVLWRVAPKWDAITKDDDVSFFPANFPTVNGQNLVNRGFPDSVASSQAILVLERKDGMLTKDADLPWIRRLTKSLNDLAVSSPDLGIKQVFNYDSPLIGERLIGTSKDGKSQATLVVVSLRGTYLAKKSREAVTAVTKLADEFEPAPSGLTRGITGSAAVGRDMDSASIASIHNTTTATIALVVGILLIVYKSPLLALIPLVTIAFSAWVSGMAIPLLTMIPFFNFQVINITKIFMIVVLFGAGTDYCLFLIARYREELARGRNNREALFEAITQVGGALVASAGTVIIGLGMLWFSTFAKIQYTGPAIALSLVIGLVASLSLAPVLLHWLRGAVFFPFKPPHHVRGADVELEMLQQTPLSGFWSHVATIVVKRPGIILAASLVVLLPFAIFGTTLKENYSQLSDLGQEQPSIQGADMIQRYFAEGELAPASILIHHPTLDFHTDTGRAAIDKVSRSIAKMPNVAEVRSVSQPLGKPLPVETPTTDGKPIGVLQRVRMETERVKRNLIDARYVSMAPAHPEDLNHITKIDVVFNNDPFSEASLNGLEEVSKRVGESMTAAGGPLEGGTLKGLAGSTAMVIDLRTVTRADQRRMYVLVTLGVFLILWALIRKPLICLYLIATVVLGYLASLGVTELVFKALHTGSSPWVGLDWKVGFFLFVILVAIGEDYNIFLMARVLEEEKKHGVVEGTRQAVAHTGGIISSCGLIMAGTLGSLLTGSLTALRELGFAMGLGVMLDTFIVRPILVPAFIVLVHRHFGPKEAPALPQIAQPQPELEVATTPN
jgi:RND superfamily putative drug exporter